MRTTGPAGGEVERFVPVHEGRLLTRPAAEGTDARLEPVLLDAEAAAPFLAQDGSIQAWLGTASEGPLAQHGIHDDASGGVQPPGFWLLELSHLPDPPSILDGSWTALRAASGPGGGANAILDSKVGMSSDDEVALLSVARGLGLWHRSVPFCAVSGDRTVPVRNGRNAQSVTGSGTRHRPRTDPSVIMLVLDRARSRCLLGRQARWPAGRYSTLAGFVEFGESLEECVVREVQEESGVRCDRASLRFVASQPWSFPRSLMVGFTVEVRAPPARSALASRSAFVQPLLASSSHASLKAPLPSRRVLGERRSTTMAASRRRSISTRRSSRMPSGSTRPSWRSASRRRATPTSRPWPATSTCHRASRSRARCSRRGSRRSNRPGARLAGFLRHGGRFRSVDRIERCEQEIEEKEHIPRPNTRGYQYLGSVGICFSY